MKGFEKVWPTRTGRQCRGGIKRIQHGAMERGVLYFPDASGGHVAPWD